MTDQRLHERLTGFEARVREAVASDVRPLPFGRLVVTAELPMVYDQNIVEVTAPHDPAAVLMAVEAAAAEARWRHRSVETTDPAIAESLRDTLLGAGYAEQRMVTMVLVGDLQAAADQRAVVVAPAAARVLGRRLLADEPWADDDMVLDQFGRREQRITEVTATVAVVAPGKEPVSRCLVLFDGSLADIDGVGTLPRHRGRGWSTAVMHTAVDHARARGAVDVALVADADDWPRRWYRRLGFREVGVVTQFRRWPEG